MRADDDSVALASEAEDTPSSSRPPKDLVTAWLLLLLDCGATYGYELHRALVARQVAVDPASVYRMLRNLERDGWVQSRWGTTSAGPRRRCYRLTASGRETLQRTAKRLITMRDGTEAFISAYEHEIAHHSDDAPVPA